MQSAITFRRYCWFDVHGHYLWFYMAMVVVLGWRAGGIDYCFWKDDIGYCFWVDGLVIAFGWMDWSLLLGRWNGHCFRGDALDLYHWFYSIVVCVMLDVIVPWPD